MITIFDKKISNKFVRIILETVVWVVGAVLLYLILHYFVFQVAEIDGHSMDPTFNDRDKVIVEILPYIFGSPEYRDIVAFPYPQDISKKFVKRIIGKPGDVIDFEDGYFYVNDEQLDDDFSQRPLSFEGIEFPVTVPEEAYFVLGDNRSISKDSRYPEVGFIKKDTIIGRISFRILPFDKIGFVN